MHRFALPSCLILAVALVFASPPAQAGKGSWEVGLLGGIGSPMGDFKDSLDAKTGPQAGLEICYHASQSFAIGVEGDWIRNKHKGEGDVEDLGGGTTLTANKDRYNILHYGIHGRYMVPTSGNLSPYGLVGVGFYNLKEDYEYTYFDGVTKTVFTDESDIKDGYFEQPGSRFGFKLGAGADYLASPKIGIGVALDWNRISMDKKKFDISSVSYFAVRGKISYHIMSQ